MIMNHISTKGRLQKVDFGKEIGDIFIVYSLFLGSLLVSNYSRTKNRWKGNDLEPKQPTKESSDFSLQAQAAHYLYKCRLSPSFECRIHVTFTNDAKGCHLNLTKC